MLDTIENIGPHAVVPVKTMIVIRAGSNFAGLTLRRDTVDLGFILPRTLAHARIHKTDRLGPSKYAHHVRLASTAEIDAQVKRWLREAYKALRP